MSGAVPRMLHVLEHFAIGAGEAPRPELGMAMIGVYSSDAAARAAIARQVGKPGFCDWPDGFRIAAMPLHGAVRGTARRQVWLLWHFPIGVGDDFDDADPAMRLVGLYGSARGADAAAVRLRADAAFRDWPDGFRRFGKELDRDSWTEGFVPGDAPWDAS